MACHLVSKAWHAQRLGDRDNTAGVGLGLALARGLVEAMGGTLTPEDTPGGGVTMVVSLPAAEAEPAGTIAPAAGDADEGPARFGQAEAAGFDEPQDRELLT